MNNNSPVSKHDAKIKPFRGKGFILRFSFFLFCFTPVKRYQKGIVFTSLKQEEAPAHPHKGRKQAQRSSYYLIAFSVFTVPSLMIFFTMTTPFLAAGIRLPFRS